MRKIYADKFNRIVLDATRLCIVIRHKSLTSTDLRPATTTKVKLEGFSHGIFVFLITKPYICDILFMISRI